MDKCGLCGNGNAFTLVQIASRPDLGPVCATPDMCKTWLSREKERAVSGDKLVVGYREFVKNVSRALEEAGSDHSCQDQNAMGYPEMAKALWACGYRFDPEARVQWLVTELRAILEPREAGRLNEVLGLLEEMQR